MKYFLFTIGFLVLLLTEIARVYFIMPFPGSQQGDSIAFAYFIQSNLGLIRLAGILLVGWPLYHFFKTGSRTTKLVVGFLLLIYVVVFYLFNFRFLADKMFRQPKNKILSGIKDNKVWEKQLVVGVSVNGESKAYPIEIIGYHHQVRDTVGGEPIMVTYCTVCRTGRVFSPMVDGQPEIFRLVGMDHFNAMFEDSRTRSWWRQVNGEAIAGELKGKHLAEIPSQQMRLDSWMKLNPNTLILQPDTLFNDAYEGLKNYDEGKSKSKLTGADSIPWQRKSWVVGVSIEKESKAYDWKELSKARIVNDIVGGKPIAVVMEGDTASFHVWSRLVQGNTLELVKNDSLDVWVDVTTKSEWDNSGTCINGTTRGARLQPVQAYQEYWHSWKTFHPETSQYKVKE